MVAINLPIGKKLKITGTVKLGTLTNATVSFYSKEPIKLALNPADNVTIPPTYGEEMPLKDGIFSPEMVINSSTQSEIYVLFKMNERSNPFGRPTGYASMELDDIIITIEDKIGTQTYDDKGRINTNDVGTYNYTNTSKPYQNSGINLKTAYHDYYQNSSNLNITYNTFKSPYDIEATGKDRISFLYNDANNRSTMFYGGTQTDKLQRPYRKHYSTDGSMEIKQDIVTGAIEFITYIGGDAYTAPVVYKQTHDALAPPSGVGGLLYLHRDYLGGIVAITNQSQQLVEKRHFDVWGSLTNFYSANGAPFGGWGTFDRGYTGHEHLQSVGLIHMNGRLYDDQLHRFLQPDNYIQDPHNTQNYNRYSYVLNNPLKYTDPSGESLLVAVIVGAIVAATSYSIQAGYTFGFQASGWGFLKATFIGAASGAATSGIGTYAETIKQLGSRIAFQALAHGTTQAIVAGIQGGDPLTGFVSGALSSIVSSLYALEYNGAKDGLGFGGNFRTSDVGILAFGTIAGGAGASLTGGNFWQGAATGLVVSGLNHLAHRMGDGIDPPKKKIDYQKEFRRIYEKSLEWASIRASSPRNLLRFTFNTVETVGAGMEVIGLAFAIPSEGVTLAYSEFGFAVNSVGVAGNTLIDFYDGQWGSGFLSVGKHIAFHGLGRVINKVSGGVTDEVILNATSKVYENYIIPMVGNKLGTVETFRRIEYKIENNSNLKIKY